MNKTKLIDSMSKHSKLSKAACKKALESFMKAVSQSLKTSKSVALTGFGTFSVIKRKSRVGINPATGSKMQIPAKKVAKFKPGKALKALIK